MLDALLEDDGNEQAALTWPVQSNVSEYINDKYRDYAKYVLHSRAIPHLIDGFKPSQRKIFYTAKRFANGTKIKTASLSGQTIAYAQFHHGDSSLNEAANLLAAPYNNNLPILVGTGTFGSRLIQEAAAPRYTFVQFNNAVDKIFLDDDILLPSDDPENPEPKYYLPIIPWVLVNGIKGIAVGWGTHILPRDPKNLAEACEQVIKGQLVDPDLLKPVFPMFSGTVEQDPADEKRWFVKGTFERKGKTTIVVTEVPYGYDRAEYIEKLEDLKTKGVISSYSDQCRDGFKFELRMSDADKLTDDQILTKLKLVKSYKENLVVIDHNNQVRVFENPLDLLAEFCKVRLAHFTRRYAHWVERDTNEKEKTDARIRFIEMVLDQTISIKDKTRAQLKKELLSHKFEEELIDTLLAMPIYHLCKDKLKELMDKSKNLAKDIETWKKMDINKAYIKDLEAI